MSGKKTVVKVGRVTQLAPAAYVQLAEGTVYAARERPVRRPAPRGMTDDEADASWDAYLRHLGHEDG